MKKIDIYIGKTVLAGILMVLLILVGLFTFFSFIDEIDDIGKQRYGLWEAIQYVGLEVPRHIYDLFPSAVLLGSLLGLGMLANHSELTVMRAAGISVIRIAIAVLKVGLVLTIVVILLGETLAPLSEQYAESMRSVAQSEAKNQRTTFSSRYGFWARDGNDFINIFTIYPNGSFGGITLYEFDATQHLRNLTYAKTAYYKDGQWQLHKVKQFQFKPNKVIRKKMQHTTWDTILRPELIKIVVIRPHKLSSLGLHRYIKYLRQNGQRTTQYELAFWTRLSYPLTGLTMIFLAIPFIFGTLRSVSVGQRILVGALLGIGFYMFNKTIGNISLVYNVEPAFSALLPPLLFLSIAILLMRRVI